MAKKYSSLILMTLPGVLYLFINNYLPMLGTFIAFKNINYTKGIFHSDWVGFKNFEFLFKSQDAFIITRNTLLYNGTFIIVNNLIIALLVALLLNEIKNRFARNLYQSIMLLPFLISFSIVGYIVLAFFSIEHGFINKVIFPFLHIQPIEWYLESKYWPYILVIVNTWKYVGYSSLIYFAAMIGINQEYYEAARMDGANRWLQMTKITLPLIRPVVIVVVLILIGRIFYADFGMFFQVPLNTGILFSTTNVIDTYVYRALLVTGDIGMSSAAGLYQSTVGFVLVIIANMLVRKWDKESALF
ncbi:sugar ABC transporter permease [Paenibacillus marchantiophytorum]|nr:MULTISPECIES: ABC transporter permease subunit [Paenibacillus]NQX70431.1 sugar ABC transporter permease [Paenibacillus alba]UKS27002.1 ABC transporter permease subunit [Paenibacillus sp. HWE-109]GGA04010.1 sugar ABC transporter permease [Paenibacillus marchantiophytorum]